MERVRGLQCWSALSCEDVEVRPVGEVREELFLGEGRTNQNFIVTSKSSTRRYFLRVGSDLPYFGVARPREQAASRAAEKAGLGPKVVYTEPDVLVLDFVKGKALTEEALHKAAAAGPGNPTLEAITDAIRRLHQVPVPEEMQNFADEVGKGQSLGWRGPHLTMWLDYAEEKGFNRVPLLDGLRTTVAKLEAAAGIPEEEVFCHYDLLPDNLVMSDDGRAMLVDFEFAAPGQALMDLAVLIMGCSLDKNEEKNFLSSYFGREASDEDCYRFGAVRVLAALRETFWGVTAELSKTSALPDEEAMAYVDTNYAKFKQLLKEFEARTPPPAPAAN